jgi:hypothetical protein
LRLRKRQGWTVVHQPGNPVTGSPGRVLVTDSNSGEVTEVAAGDEVFVDATLELTPLELGWELVP